MSMVEEFLHYPPKMVPMLTDSETDAHESAKALKSIAQSLERIAKALEKTETR